MKKILFLLFAASTLMAAAQNKSTVETRALVHNLNQAKSVDNMSKTLLQRYPVININNKSYIGVIAKVDGDFDAADLKALGIRITSEVENIIVLRVPVEQLAALESVRGIETYTVAHRVSPEMNKTRVDTRTDSIQAGLGVPQPFNGEGVLIGITDWGFDYTHPNINKNNNKRIIRAWDHFKLSGPAPEGFDYGTEYRTPEEVRAAKCDTAGLYGYGTHGTHVAGICGGNGTNAGEAIGQAPGAQFIVGSFLLDEASWLDQVAWMKQVADGEGKRLVINSSWGMYTFSTLDGTSLLSQAINSYSNQGVVFVTSGGNNGYTSHPFHISRTFASGTPDTLRTVVGRASDIYQKVDEIGQALILWGEPERDFTAGIGILAGGTLYPSPMFSTALGDSVIRDTIIVGTDTVTFRLLLEHANPFNNRPHMQFDVDRTNHKTHLFVTADNGTVHAWNLANLKNNAGNQGCSFSNGSLAGYSTGDNRYGIGEPACAEKAISVAAHTADRMNVGNVYYPGNLAGFSSSGPLINGRQKPDISAPGDNVVSSISYWADNSEDYPQVEELYTSNRSYKWSTMSGTSMSSPAVSGIVALILQANPDLTPDQVRDIIVTTARNDIRTGALIANDSADLRWGWGKIDALRAVNKALTMVGIQQVETNRTPLRLFPNPATAQVTVLTGCGEQQTLDIYSVDGRHVMQAPVSIEATLDISHLNPGVYIVRVGSRTEKLIVR